MAQDPYRYFRVEAQELIEGIGKGSLELEKGVTPDRIARLLRLTHTLKGAARVVRQREMADEAHALEDALEPLRGSAAPVPRERIDVFLALADAMGKRLAALDPAPEARVVSNVQSPPEELTRTIRADIEEIDSLVEGVAEVHAQLEPLRRSRAVVERAKHIAEILVDQLRAPRARGTARVGPTADNLRSMAEEMRLLVGAFELNLATALDHVDRELDQLRHTTEQLRLCPASNLFPALERTARDTAHSLHRVVAFEGHGGSIRLDAHVLGEVQAALVQIVRNAIAHGIEPERERVAAGKTSSGRVTLDIARRGRFVVFTGSDDGRGVDLDAVRRVILEKREPSTAAQESGPDELLARLLEGGISTSTVVTDVSGRGVGLDMVREAAKRLGGTAVIRTAVGEGTTVELAVPLSVASLEGLVVEASGVTVTIPLDAVRRTQRIATTDIARTADGESVMHEGRTIPFLPLSRALSSTRVAASAAHTWSTVIVEGSGGLAALGVDRLLGTASVVLRPLPELAPASAIVAGASLDAEGNPRLVLDPDALVAAAACLIPTRRESQAQRGSILVIDDSLTTRMLEQSILESAGYAVDVATSGEEALEKARHARYALFLVDVEMPGMDGFAFIERTRQDAELRDTPAILVSSRSSAEDQARGVSVGAAAYIVKSDFNQVELLRRIEKLVG